MKTGDDEKAGYESRVHPADLATVHSVHRLILSGEAALNVAKCAASFRVPFPFS